MFTRKQEDENISEVKITRWSSFVKLSLICLVALVIFTTTQQQNVFSYSTEDYLEWTYNCSWLNKTETKNIGLGFHTYLINITQLNCTDAPTNLSCSNTTTTRNDSYYVNTFNDTLIQECMERYGITIVSKPSNTNKYISFENALCEMTINNSNYILTCKEIDRGGHNKDGRKNSCLAGEVCAKYNVSTNLVLSELNSQKDKDGVKVNVK